MITATERSTQPQNAPLPRRFGARRFASTFAIVIACLAMAACDLVGEVLGTVVDNIHTLEVVNLCGGSDTYVDVYLNGQHRGTVYLRASYTILTGPLSLRAEGTGARGTIFSDSTYVDGNLTWTLCPVSGYALSTGADRSDDEQGSAGLLTDGVAEDAGPPAPIPAADEPGGDVD